MNSFNASAKPCSGRSLNRPHFLKALLFKSLVLAASAVSFNGVAAYEAPKAQTSPAIDGVANDVAWQQAPWRAIDQHIAGSIPSSDDFSGRYKLVWDENRLYLLAEIIDDVLYDANPNPLEKYWDDDCLEVFIDEDRSGGDHQLNFNAFAYHIALDNQVVDIGPNHSDGSTNFVLLNDHITSVWKRSSKPPYPIIWEAAIAVYGDDFKLDYPKGEIPAKPVRLTNDKVMGFMLAYCDNDGSAEREHFMGSEAITPVDGDKNLGYKTADVFGELRLVD